MPFIFFQSIDILIPNIEYSRLSWSKIHNITLALSKMFN